MEHLILIKIVTTSFLIEWERKAFSTHLSDVDTVGNAVSGIVVAPIETGQFS